MKKRLLSLILPFIICHGIHCQYISSVLDYSPAPGQFINKPPAGIPSSFESIKGNINGMLNLGSFGGFIIFSFENPVENHPDNPYGVDFTIFGNPLETWAEPAVVSVMKDENKNGLPDDTWYELAGSDHFFSSTVKNYQVTYRPPSSQNNNVTWSDNQGNEGAIPVNEFHPLPYYPDPDSFLNVPETNYKLSGTKIDIEIDNSNPFMLVSKTRKFGYADNHSRGSSPYLLPDNPYTPEIENSGGDAFDINWAINSEGTYVDLDMIHFIKIHNAVLEDAGVLGEVSSEITGAVDVPPDPEVTGPDELIVVKDVPDTIISGEFELEVFFFKKGRLQEGTSLNWTSENNNAYVDSENIVHLEKSGDVLLNVNLPGKPEVSHTIEFIADLNSTSSTKYTRANSDPFLFPNPAGDFVQIRGIKNASVVLYDSHGRIVKEMNGYTESVYFDISDIPPGICFIKINENNRVKMLKFLKQ